LRTIGKDMVRDDDPRLRKDDVIRTMRTVLRYMTRAERDAFVSRYGSLKELSDFRLEFAHDNDPDSQGQLASLYSSQERTYTTITKRFYPTAIS